MSVTVETGTTLAFDRFWRWLKRHPHCILRAGTPDAFLYDQDDLHWRIDEDDDRVPTVQLMRGKALIAEVAIDARDILFVQVTPDPEGEAGQHLFEVIGGGDEPYPVYHFLLAHGFEDEGSGHRQNVLKQ
ncbi:MAG TPA: hypothetical protein VFP50_05370 [Anaeromyxobacteraceae bacterium]|nr:hypothetical protein [Anaeromyxobacteraceae bacterium]